jgi:membrane-associated phospholipid phosphatase
LCGQAHRSKTNRRRFLFPLTRYLAHPKKPFSLTLLLLFSSVQLRAGDNIKSAGDILQLALPATAAGLIIGYNDREGAVEFTESIALTLGTTYVLKYTVDERRPNGGTESFPSAHTSISFSAAEFMRKRYGWEYGLPAYAAASFVAYSRVEAGEHHPHDVIAMAATHCQQLHLH